LPLALGLAVLKIGALVALTFLLGGRLIPWLLGRVAQTRSRELFTLTVLVVALGIAVGSAALFGVSMALGAFLAGMVVGRSDFSLRAATEALPMRDAFAVLFFVSVGMLFDPGYLLQAPWVVLATLGIILLGKPLAALGIVLLPAIRCGSRWVWRSPWPRSASSPSSWRPWGRVWASCLTRPTARWSRPPSCPSRSTRSCTAWSIRPRRRSPATPGCRAG
jgi:hypothetical protein